MPVVRTCPAAEAVVRCQRRRPSTVEDMTVVGRLARLIDGLPGDRVLVAFDGPDAAGKTTLAREVAGSLARPAICASVDGWHHPREVRLRRGSESPEGYYLDSFNLEALVDDLLTPFRRGASYVPTSRFDHRADTAVRTDQHVAERAALLFDGVFLLRQELVTQWDLRVYVHVAEEITLSRGLERDLDLFGGEAALRHRYELRYLPGQALYRDCASPREAADVVLDNSDWRNPVILRWPAGS